MARLWYRWVDWATDHPHRATMLVMLAFALFIALTVITNGTAFVVVLNVAVLTGLYFAIYSMFNGTF